MNRHVVFAALASLALLIAAQETPFRAGLNLVQVPVSVTDSAGRNVDGLTARDFELLDDGTPRAFTLDTFGSGAAPISLVLAIQSPGISAAAMAKIHRIGALIQPLVIGRRGEAAVVTFDSRVRWRQDFTSDSETIQSVIKGLRTGTHMESRMFDAVAAAAEKLKTREGRRVLMLISESRDRGSETKFEQAMQAVEREGIQVFAAHYSAAGTAWIANPEDLPPPSGANFITAFTELARLGKTNHILAFTQATGGSDYPFLKERGIEKAIERLGVDVHAQYILGFPQGSAEPGMHHIAVSLPKRGNVRIRAREAYVAGSAFTPQ